MEVVDYSEERAEPGAALHVDRLSSKQLVLAQDLVNALDQEAWNANLLFRIELADYNLLAAADEVADHRPLRLAGIVACFNNNRIARSSWAVRGDKPQVTWSVLWLHRIALDIKGKQISHSCKRRRPGYIIDLIAGELK
nr:hypothetical protein [Chelativorans sp.]